ncbi:MAG: NlpC/P60 family protein [Pseudomonadota bacterium]
MNRAQIVAAARGWIGTRYHHQASVRGIGCDCLGLVRGIWRELIGPEPEIAPPYTPDWAEACQRETLLEASARNFVEADEIRPGTMLIFRWKTLMPAKHCGIASDDGRFIHAHDSAGRVVEVSLSKPWARRIAAKFDFPGVTD